MKATAEIKGSSQADLSVINHRQKRRPGDNAAYETNWEDTFVTECETCGERHLKSTPHDCKGGGA